VGSGCRGRLGVLSWLGMFRNGRVEKQGAGSVGRLATRGHARRTAQRTSAAAGRRGCLLPGCALRLARRTPAHSPPLPWHAHSCRRHASLPPAPPRRSPEPIAAASLGQVYKGRLRSTGEQVAVKVQRPGVLETVTVDLYIIRQLGLFLRRFPAITRVRPAGGGGGGCQGWATFSRHASGCSHDGLPGVTEPFQPALNLTPSPPTSLSTHIHIHSMNLLPSALLAAVLNPQHYMRPHLSLPHPTPH
jgi:hypothetical protein